MRPYLLPSFSLTFNLVNIYHTTDELEVELVHVHSKLEDFLIFNVILMTGLNGHE